MNQEEAPLWGEQLAYDRKRAAELAAATEQCILVAYVQKADLDYAVELGMISRENRGAKQVRDLVVKVFGAYFDRVRKDAVEAARRRQEAADRAAQEAGSMDDIRITISVRRSTAEALPRFGYGTGDGVYDPDTVREAIISALADRLHIRRDGDEIGSDHQNVSAFMARPGRTGTGGLRVRNTARDLGRI